MKLNFLTFDSDLSKEDFYNAFLLSIFAIFIALMRVQYSQHEDMGIFLSEFAFIAHGHLPYKDIYEIKDPLFLLSGGWIFDFFGRQGIYLLDAVLMALAAPLSYKIGRRLELTPLNALIAAIIFTLTMLGSYYQALRSTLFALVLFLFFFEAILSKKFIVAGLFLALIGGFKMPYLFLAPSLLLFIQSKSEKRIMPIIRVGGGFLIGLGLIILMLMKLNIFWDYIKMVGDNFRYASSYQEIVGMEGGIEGHIKSILNYNFNFYIAFGLLIGVTSLSLITTPKAYYIRVISLGLLSFFTLLLCSMMVMWPHHLHVTAYYIWPFCIIILLSLQYLGSEKKKGMGSPYYFVTRFCFVFFLVISISFFGDLIPKKANETLQTILKPNWYIPPEVGKMNELHQETHLNKNFARLGMNDDMGLAGFLDSDWRLVCSRYGQYGIESEATLNETLSCIANKANFLVVSQAFFDTKRPVKVYNEFKDKALAIMAKIFDCQAVSPGSANLICVRKL